MICTEAVEYPPNHHRKPGDRFEVEEKHAELLKTLGRAKLADEGYKTRDMTAAPADAYSTRDMAQKRKRGRPRKGG